MDILLNEKKVEDFSGENFIRVLPFIPSCPVALPLYSVKVSQENGYRLWNILGF